MPAPLRLITTVTGRSGTVEPIIFQRRPESSLPAFPHNPLRQLKRNFTKTYTKTLEDVTVKKSLTFLLNCQKIFSLPDYFCGFSWTLRKYLVLVTGFWRILEPPRRIL